MEGDELIFDHGRMQGHRSLLRAEWACASAAIRLPPACWLACLLPAVSTASSKLFGAVRPERGKKAASPKAASSRGDAFWVSPSLAPLTLRTTQIPQPNAARGLLVQGLRAFVGKCRRKVFFLSLSGSPEAAAPRLPRNRGRPGRKACPTPVLTAHRRLLRPSQNSRDWGLAHWQHRP